MFKITGKELEAIFAAEGFSPESIQEALVKKLTEKNKSLATAESCTGGLISKRLTDVSGASAVFGCGVCSYANEIKIKLLGVSRDTLDTVGAVSEDTARQMAQGVRELAGADYGISTTGIAGPTGGSAAKPVGLVYIGVCSAKGTRVTEARLGDIDNADRDSIRSLAASAALYFALKAIDE